MAEVKAMESDFKDKAKGSVLVLLFLFVNDYVNV